MKGYRDTQADLEEEIGRDVENIMRGNDVRSGRGSAWYDPETGKGSGNTAPARGGCGRTGGGAPNTSRRGGRAGGPQRPQQPGRNAGRNPAPAQRADGRAAQAPAPSARSGEPSLIPGMEDSGIGGPKKRKSEPEPSRTPYVFISYFFVLIFVSLIGYLVYFNVRLKDDVLNSPYNKRQNALAQVVTRGELRSADGTTLAYTKTDEDGEETRVYPEDEMYAHVIGYASNGKSGLESLANYELLTSHYNLIDRIINEFREVKNPGDTVVTTLNHELQEAAYDALGSYDGAVIALDPKTGDCLAMVSKPDFDPNTIEEDWEEIVSDSGNSQLVNRALQGAYPPGSTFKIVTALSYLRTYGDADDFSYDCEGTYTLKGGDEVHCYGGTAHGEEDFTGAFANSCNCAFSEIGLDLSAGQLRETAKSLLFGEKLPIRLNYRKSSFSLEDSSSDFKLVQTAFGQGDTLISPYYIALLASAVANDGVVMQTNLIDHIETADGDFVSEPKRKEYKRILSSEEAEELKELMEAVVTDGTGGKLDGEDYYAACKTGSAEYVKADGELGTHSWFVGFAGEDEDDIGLVVAVIAENGGSGSGTALPIAKQVFEAYY